MKTWNVPCYISYSWTSLVHHYWISQACRHICERTCFQEWTRHRPISMYSKQSILAMITWVNIEFIDGYCEPCHEILLLKQLRWISLGRREHREAWIKPPDGGWSLKLPWQHELARDHDQLYKFISRSSNNRDLASWWTRSGSPKMPVRRVLNDALQPLSTHSTTQHSDTFTADSHRSVFVLKSRSRIVSWYQYLSCTKMLSLPADVLFLVLGEISKKDDFNTLFNCALTSKSLAGLALQWLYRWVYLRLLC